MIEKTLLDYLKSCLDVPVYMEIPSNPPTSFVVVEKTGSSVDSQIKRAIFAIQSYDATLYKTACLNELVKGAMENMPYEANVGKAQLNTDYNYTDKTSKKYRYQAIYEITY